MEINYWELAWGLGSDLGSERRRSLLELSVLMLGSIFERQGRARLIFGLGSGTEMCPGMVSSANGMIWVWLWDGNAFGSLDGD